MKLNKNNFKKVKNKYFDMIYLNKIKIPNLHNCKKYI